MVGTDRKRVSVVGAGAWGTAIACQVARQGHDAVLWGLESEVADEINQQRRNSVYLPEAPLPEGIRATDDLVAAVAGADVVVLVPPSKHLRAVASQLRGTLTRNTRIVVASKGIEESSLQMMSEVLAEALPELGREQAVFLSGPSFAREVASGLPTDVVVASEDPGAARHVQSLFHSPIFRVYSSDDPIGVQVGGAIKNVMAVASGACDGLALGTNARAALITRGLAEMTRLGVALGADPLTFLGLAGVGDLVLTCTGNLSRNRTLGMKVAEGVDPTDYLASQRSVAEGFSTSAAASALAQRVGVEMPIAEQVYHVLHSGRALGDAVQRLVTRGEKGELDGIRGRAHRSVGD